ncbi:hypothetical protein A2U01_0093372, partial [Trifolium medium]|nr:hypothetical protein [Trifolium medium]
PQPSSSHPLSHPYSPQIASAFLPADVAPALGGAPAGASHPHHPCPDRPDLVVMD